MTSYKNGLARSGFSHESNALSFASLGEYLCCGDKELPVLVDLSIGVGPLGGFLDWQECIQGRMGVPVPQRLGS